MRKRLFISALLALAISAIPRSSQAYIEVPYSLGQVVRDSSYIVLMKVESVDRDKNTIIYRKVEDIKGKHPLDVIKHNIAHAGFNAREWQNVMAWAAEGKLAVMCHNGSASETCIDNYWYQAYPGKDGASAEWWNMYHGEPYLLRSYAGKPEKFAQAVKAMLQNEEVIVPCMVDGDKNALSLRTARIQRMRASLKLLDYNASRDFAGWGGEEIVQLKDMPGFGQLSVLAKLDGATGGGGWGVATGHMESADKTDLVLFNESRIVVLKNEGEGSFDSIDVRLPANPDAKPDAKPPEVDLGGARSAAWADYNSSKRQSILLATPTGPKLLTNMGAGIMRDDSAALPKATYAGLTAAAWINLGKPDRPAMLLADEFSGLRVLENKVGTLHARNDVPEVKFKDISDSVGLGENGLGAGAKVDDLIVTDLFADGSLGEQIVVSTADGRILVLAFKDGAFTQVPIAGVHFNIRAQLAIGDINSDGLPDIIALGDGGAKAFRNVSQKGMLKFEDITRYTGLGPVGGTSIAFVPRGGREKANVTADLVVGCLHGSNRYFKNDGRGSFIEATADVGLDRRIFNTRGLAVLPSPNGNADLVMLNEGQPSSVLIWKK